MSKKEEVISLGCPKCSTETEYRPSVKVQCKKCETDFNGFSFIKKKLKVPATLLVALSAGIGVTATSKVIDDRLPYEAEYRLMQACINGEHAVRSRSLIFKKAEVCGCMIEEAIDKIGITRKRNEPDEVVDAFGAYMEQAFNKCS